ncbi:MAG: hypothetical protein IAB08_02855 [Bacteroidetes bacterium]|uniref:Uncharacterized protein n=1 Tax=Candidatus Pullibacteroides excrementavium TaxID=2840905 RepID=A0A9D9DRH7_9BACT|nr:hypothetical protein [Candidatus Pullibacteroides excrementavium]
METIKVPLNKHIVDDAQIYARQKGLKLSELIESYLQRLVGNSKKAKEEEIPDIVLSLLGAGMPVEEEDLNARDAYHEYLKEKYK